MHLSPYQTAYPKLQRAILDDNLGQAREVKKSGLTLSIKQYNDVVQRCLRQKSSLDILKEVCSFLIYSDEVAFSKGTSFSFETLQMGLSSPNKEVVEFLLNLAPITVFPLPEQKKYFLTQSYELVPNFEEVARRSSLSPLQKIQFVSERQRTSQWGKDQDRLRPFFEHSLQSTSHLSSSKLLNAIFPLGLWYRNMLWEELKKRNVHAQFVKQLFTQLYSVVSKTSPSINKDQAVEFFAERIDEIKPLLTKAQFKSLFRWGVSLPSGPILMKENLRIELEGVSKTSTQKRKM